jgi:hypothetical protein
MSGTYYIPLHCQTFLADMNSNSTILLTRSNLRNTSYRRRLLQYCRSQLDRVRNLMMQWSSKKGCKYQLGKGSAGHCLDSSCPQRNYNNRNTGSTTNTDRKNIGRVSGSSKLKGERYICGSRYWSMLTIVVEKK